MKKIVTILLLVICVCQATNAKVSSDNDLILSLSDDTYILLFPDIIIDTDHFQIEIFSFIVA